MITHLPKAALLVVLPLLAAPAFAAPDVEPETETEKTEQVEEKKICKRIATETSSRRRTKVCLTREEWKTFNRDQRRN